MITTLMQTDVVWADPEANRRKLDAMLSALPETDLVVLPEMFSTGFMPDPAGRAETDGGTLEWMLSKSKEYGFAMAGSISTEEQGRFYNRFYFVEPDGKVTIYDKRHLFSISGEDRIYTPGNRRVTVEYRGARILLQVCYDLRFPETCRNTLREDGTPDYDLAIFVASWPSRRVSSWNTLLKARAIENQSFVIGVNRVGSDPECDYPGESVLLDPMGRTVVSCGTGCEVSVTGEMDLRLLSAFRDSFPALKDIL
jgi:predicted amidohydrolase